MPVLIPNRDDRVSTTAGHTIIFEVGVEKFVPDIPAVVRACTERGHVVKREEKAPKAAAPKPSAKASAGAAASPRG